jgi:hypothetical protein
MHLPHDFRAVVSGLLGAIWLLGLWYAAPLVQPVRTHARQAAATMALGCFIPLALGAFGLLYEWSLWVGLGAVVAARAILSRRGRIQPRPTESASWDLLVGFGVLLALAWPIAVRPTIDGDTLIYHLPNAASWVAHHSIWTTGTRYWWYPPASEIFAAGLLATGGVDVVGWAGMLPGVLLLLTVRAVARRQGMPAIAGTLLACALLATPVAAVQLVSLQNDLWLTALFLFALSEYAAPAIGMLALTKPYGFHYAIVAGLTCRERRPVTSILTVALVPAGVWVLRDLILLPHAIVPVGTSAGEANVRTTIAAHLPHSLVVLAAASWHAGVIWTLCFVAGIAAIAFSRDVRLRWAALAATVIFAFVPTAFEGGTVQQLATGASLRFGLPVAAAGLAWILSLQRRAVAVAAAAAGIGTAIGIGAQWQLFYNDATTRDAPLVVGVALLSGAASWLLRDSRLRAAAQVLPCIVLGMLAGGLAGSHPADYIADRYGGAFAFVASEKIVRVVTLGLPAGAATTVDPNVDAYDGLDTGACAEARRLNAVVVASAEKLRSLDCGRILYRDGATAVVDPRT